MSSQHFAADPIVAPPELWLGLTSTAWSGIAALSAAATVVVAGVAAYFALKQLSQARELAEEQARPYLTASLEESEADWSISDFVVRNVGQTAAKNITVTIDPPYVRAKKMPGFEFMKARFLMETTPVLPPGARLMTFLDTSQELSDADEGTAQSFTVTLEYFDRLGRKSTDVYTFDPRQMHGTIRTDVHGIHHLAKSVRGIAEKMGVTRF